MFESILRTPDKISIVTDEKKVTAENEAAVTCGDANVCFKDGCVTLTADKTPVKAVELTWNAETPAETVFMGDDYERGYGNFEWHRFRHDRIYPWYVLLFCGDHTGFYGVKTLPDSICTFKITPHEIILRCDTRCGNEGVVLCGKTITAAQVVCGDYDGISVFEAGISACRTMVTKAVFPKETVYGFNNWYYAYGKSSYEEIIANSRHLASVTKGIENRPYMVIDDCWQKYRLGVGDYENYIGGPWRESNVKFPDMKKLAEEITAMGNKPGIWIRSTQNRADDITPDMYFNKQDYILDISQQKVLDYIAGDVRTIVGWGYKLIKNDYSTFDISGKWGKDMEDGFSAIDDCRFADNSKTTAMLIKGLYKTIHDAADGKAIIIGCNTVGHLGTGYFEINRTGDDTSGCDFERTRKMGVNTLAFRMWQNNIFYMSDADCVGIMEQMDHKKNAQWMELLAKSGTPMFVSVGPETLSEEGNRYLAEMMKCASEPHPQAEPLDIMTTACPEKWKLYDGVKEFCW